MRHLVIPVSVAATALVGAVLFLGLDPSVPTPEPGGDTNPVEIETSPEDRIDSPAAPDAPTPPVVAAGPATLTGVVKDERGAVLADARVTLRRPGTRTVRTVEVVTAESDAKGHFSLVLATPPRDALEILVTRAGYVPAQDTWTWSGEAEDLEIRLQQIRRPETVAARPRVDVRGGDRGGDRRENAGGRGGRGGRGMADRGGGRDREAMRTQMVDRFDADGDGELSEEERNALREQMRGQRGGQGGQRGGQGGQRGGQGGQRGGGRGR